MRQPGRAAVLATLLPAVVVAGLTWRVNERYADHSKTVTARSAVLEAIGIPLMAFSADCSATKALTEGISGCLGDAPAAYCYHASCDTVCAPDVPEEEVFLLRFEP